MDAIHVSELPRDLVGRLSPWRKLRLSWEILGIYARVRLRLVTNEFPAALEALRTVSRPVAPLPDSAATHLRAARLAWAVRRTLWLLPTDARCLMQSLVLTTLLARRGIATTLLIGVQPGDDFEAHAWLEYHGRPLLPQGHYQVLTEL